MDTIVDVKPPDAEAAARLVQMYSRDLLAANTDLGKVGTALAGSIPAVIREIVEKSKIGAIVRQNRAALSGHAIELQITTEDLLDSAKTMKQHEALIERNTRNLETEKLEADLHVRIPAGTGWEEADQILYTIREQTKK